LPEAIAAKTVHNFVHYNLLALLLVHFKSKKIQSIHISKIQITLVKYGNFWICLPNAFLGNRGIIL
jgi:hypothetical protein